MGSCSTRISECVVHPLRVSDAFIRLIPTDPIWQPTSLAAAAVAAYVIELFAGPNASVDEVAYEYFDSVAFIDSGVNTSDVTCPACRSRIDFGLVMDVVDERQDDLANLDVEVPCCGALSSLNQLEYDWTMGFARFEVTAMNANRGGYELTENELGHVAALLGHPVRQILAHY